LWLKAQGSAIFFRAAIPLRPPMRIGGEGVNFPGNNALFAAAKLSFGGSGRNFFAPNPILIRRGLVERLSFGIMDDACID
jgi:hypothetical protein